MRILLRVAGPALALALVSFWFLFVRGTFSSAAGGVPAPGAFVVGLLFSGVAIAGGLAGARGDGVVIALCGLLSFVPVGLYLFFFPGPTRWIAPLDLGLLVVGLLLLRRDAD